MLGKRLLEIHWICFVLVLILTSLTISRIIIKTNWGENIEVVPPEMIDKAAIQIILYFLIMPVFTIIFWLIRRTWVFFPWQHKKGK